MMFTSCWNNIATSLLPVCYNLCVFTCALLIQRVHQFLIIIQDAGQLTVFSQNISSMKTVKTLYYIFFNDMQLFQMSQTNFSANVL
jgi:hypothetical protein